MTGRKMRTRVLSHMRAITITAFCGLVAFLALGNLAIFSAMVWAKTTAPKQNVEAPAEVMNFQVVDDKVWRGSHPRDETFRDLAQRGVTTVVDLRAEEGIHVNEELLDRLGITRFNLPLRDGQVPTETQVRQFLSIVENAPGKVYVHCMAGVGRTGAMVAAYLVATGQEDPAGALRRNLSVGPPSLEQLAFVAELTPTDADRPNPVVTGLSRVLDAPRRIWSHIN
ncbi:MAG TPA: dual specificity protein phosphatase family protein [Actinomycetota bacterium]|nr:dual specificity protein phosphatase family protein [Actinomycetota bacterium]